MSNICAICGKGSQTGRNVSHSKRRTSHTWKPNLTKFTLKNGNQLSTMICSRCRKTLSKPVAKKKRAKE